MKNEELKTLWKFAKLNLITGFVIWFLSTAFFLVYEGWHVKSTNPIEIWFDEFVSIFWSVGLFTSVYVAANFLKKL